MQDVLEKTPDVLARVQESFKSAFDVDPKSVTIDTLPADVPGWDSMGHVSLASCLEQEFGVSLDVDELMEMENVRAIVRVLEAKLKKQ